MRRWGNRTRVMIGLWILAGLAVVGANGFFLMSLLDEPLAGYSNGVRQADRAFREYRLRVNVEANRITAAMDWLVRRFAPEPVAKETPAVVEIKRAASPAGSARAVPAPVALPALSGIVTRRSSDGTVNCLALLDGSLKAEGDTIQSFTVRGISAGGVLLSRGRQTWRLEAPDVAHSVMTP